ncbi:6783_t:CDS:2 [Cetraspora pellucida]|uniref:6783_t:CDS:1 n=1 Tax=Cetraspora pellucida TaxID=1433469 RepID=A0A9N9EQ44_9GLOM|nr:6783_t:CDS:2 [Cetraspora pellucida]
MDEIIDTSDTNADDSFSQVLESSLSNILTKPPSILGNQFCCKCGQVYESSTGVSALRKHLENHQIQASKKKQATLQIYHKDPHNEQEQQKEMRSVNILEAISSILNEFKLNNKIMALTTDNESAMVVCGHLLAKELENEFNNIGIDNNLISELYPNHDDQQKLQPLEKATKHLSAASYPTHEEYSQKNIAISIYNKLVEYWEIMDHSSIVSAVLDPHTRLKIFSDTEEQKNAIDQTH